MRTLDDGGNLDLVVGVCEIYGRSLDVDYLKSLMKVELQGKEMQCVACTSYVKYAY